MGNMNNPQIDAILAVVQVYLDGLYEGDTAKLRQAFHPAAHLFSATEDKLVDVPLDQWCEMVAGRPSPQSKGQSREYERILSVDLTGSNTAMVKLNCAIPPRLFTDYLSFIKLNGRWQVINKTYHFDLLKA